MANATFVHVCLNLLKSKDHICDSFSIQGNSRKCHICLKFAVVIKSRYNMVLFLIFGGVVNMMLKLKFCKYFPRNCKFHQTVIIAPFSKVSKSEQILLFVPVCSE